MKPKTSRLFYPVTPEYIEGFVGKITKSILSGQSITFIFQPNQGGNRAWIKFILNNPKCTNIYTTLSSYSFFYFEVADCLDSSNLAFFYQLLKTLSKGEIAKYESVSLEEIISLLKQKINSLLKKKKVVIFLPKLDSFPNLNLTLGNLMYSLWRDHKNNLSFVTTFSNESYITNLNDHFGDFSEILTQNIEYIKPLSDENILHSVRHWEHNLKYKFSEAVRQLIVKYSYGSPYVSKILCQNLFKENSQNAESVCKQIAQQGMWIPKTKLSICFDSKTFSFLLNNENITFRFTNQEQETLKLLIDKKNILVTRDDIAEALWGKKSYEKYSDWAIDQLVSMLRKKLSQLNTVDKIQTIRGKGIILLQSK
jgi:hypothetical protein